jgi:hypothetical protein
LLTIALVCFAFVLIAAVLGAALRWNNTQYLAFLALSFACLSAGLFLIGVTAPC